MWWCPAAGAVIMVRRRATGAGTGTGGTALARPRSCARARAAPLVWLFALLPPLLLRVSPSRVRLPLRVWWLRRRPP